MLSLFILLILLSQSQSTDLELDINEEEVYAVLDETIGEVDELDDVLLSCNENAGIYTKSTIKNLLRSNSFNKLDNEDHKSHVMAWQILNVPKQFSTNLSYLLIKQVSYKDSGIYYCIFRIPYSSFFSSILPSTFVSKLSKLWSGCQASNQFECLASFKFKLIVKKAKQRTLNSLKLPEELKEKCLIIKNGKQLVQDKTLSLIAMFLATLIFILLLFYFIRMYRENWISSKNLSSKKSHKKQLKRQRSEQIQENLEIIKDFEHIKHDEQELLKKLRLEQERLSNKRREDEEFFNRMKSQELDLIKRKEKIVREEEELLKKRLQFENEKKMNKNSRIDEEILIKQDKNKIVQHLGDEFEVHERRLSRKFSSKEKELNLKDLDNLTKPISLNIKGEIKLKHTDDENKQLVDHSNSVNEIINLNNLSKKLKKSRKKIFSLKKSPIKLNYEKYRDLTNLRLFDSSNAKFRDRSPTSRPKFNFNRYSEDRKAFLKRKLATNIGLTQNLKRNLKTDFNRFDNLAKSSLDKNNLDKNSLNKNKLDKNNLNKSKLDLNNLTSPLADFKKSDLNKNSSSALDIESTIDIRKKNESIFKTLGKFKVNSEQCKKAIKLVVETPFPLTNKPNLPR